ncbi:hypothetical protein AX16_005462 [Volvariella volvacea WC 439]|nr:hypothetical protein AX16_005462 [Volvariella volvacea WC 439]
MPRRKTKSIRPTIDDANPFYCPSVPPSLYLANLRQGRRTRSGNNYPPSQYPPNSFLRILRQAVGEDGTCLNSDDELETSNSSGDNTAHESLSLHPPWSEDSSTLPVSPSFSLSRSQVSGPLLKRVRSSSFSDLLGPPLFRKSIQSVHESSFEVSVRHEKLKYSVPRRKTKKSRSPVAQVDGLEDISDIAAQGLAARVRMLEDELYGPPVGTESPRGLQSLISRLDSLLPGIRLKDRLCALDPLTHQSIADYLGSNGHLNENVLSILRTSEITSLHLTPSLIDQAGLNVSGPEILAVFGKPNSFLFLSKLNMSGTPLQDYDLKHIHHLPRLSALLLSSTGIGNEGVFHLVSLKRSLTRLSLSKNPMINNDAVPALVLMIKLSYLSIEVTGIDILGLRPLCRSVLTHSRSLTVLLPQACERYILGIGNNYLVNPAPPLITNPDLCTQLSIAALERNLVAHAGVNPSIITTGSRQEMIERLYRILKTRQEDVVVQAVIRGVHRSTTND